MEKILVIADDLTGATNSASLLLDGSSGIKVFIESASLGHEDLYSLKDNSVIVLNTNTRTENKKSACKAIISLSQIIKEFSPGIIIKKIDTAYRGNVAAETDALMKSSGRKYAFIINSIPSMNRITVGGFQIIDGRFPIESDFSFELHEKAQSSFVPDILGKDLELKPALLRLEEIRRGQANLERIIKSHIENNIKTMVFDSVTDEDIYISIKAVNGIISEMAINDAVWVGSLGLIEAIKRNCMRDINGCFANKKNLQIKEKNNKGNSTRSSVKVKKILGVSASMHSISHRQLLRARNEGVAALEVIDFEELTGIGTRDIGRIALQGKDQVNAAAFDIAGSKVLGKYISRINQMLEKTDVFITLKISETLKREPVEKLILGAVVEIVRSLLPDKSKAEKISRLILTGGETSFHILKGFNTRSICILDKIENGIDYGLIQDGLLEGKELLIKGGSVGDDESVIKMINYNYPLARLPFD